MPSKDEKAKDKKKAKGNKEKKRKEKGKNEESKNKKSPKAKNYSDRAAKKAEKEKKLKDEKEKKIEKKEIEAEIKNVGLGTESITKKKKKESKEEREPKVAGGLARLDGSQKPSSLLRKKSAKKVTGKKINKLSESNGEKAPKDKVASKDSKLRKQIHDDPEKDEPTASTQLSELIDKLNNAATKLMESKAENKDTKDPSSKKSEKLKKVPKVKSPFFNTNAADLEVVKAVPEKNEKRKSQREKSSKLFEDVVKKQIVDSEPSQESTPETAKGENQKSDKKKRKTSSSSKKDDKKSLSSRKGKKKQKQKLDLPPPPSTPSTTGTSASSKNKLDKTSSREDLSQQTQMSVQNDDVIAKKPTGSDASVTEDTSKFKKGSKKIKSSRLLRVNKKKKGDKESKKKKSKRDKKESEDKKEKKSKKGKQTSEKEKSHASDKSGKLEELKNKLFDKPQKKREPFSFTRHKSDESLAKNKPISDDFVEKIKQLSKRRTSAPLQVSSETTIGESSEATGSKSQPTTPISSSEGQTDVSKVSDVSALDTDTLSTNTQQEVEAEKKLIQKLIKLVRVELTDPTQLDSRDDDNEWIRDQPSDDQPILQSDADTKDSSVFNETSTTEGFGTTESESMITTETNTDTTSTAIGKRKMPVDSIMQMLEQRNEKEEVKQSSKIERKATRMINDIFAASAREEANRAKMDEDRVRHGKLTNEINKLENLQKELGIDRRNHEFKRIPHSTKLMEIDTSNDVILGRRSNRAPAYSNVMFELINQSRNKPHSKEWRESLVKLQTSISLRYNMTDIQESNIVRALFKDFNLTNKNCLQLLSRIEHLRIISPRDSENFYSELWLILAVERIEITANKFSQILKPYLKQGTLAFSFKRQY